jgi:hypothetical protein
MRRQPAATTRLVHVKVSIDQLPAVLVPQGAGTSVSFASRPLLVQHPARCEEHGTNHELHRKREQLAALAIACSGLATLWSCRCHDSRQMLIRCTPQRVRWHRQWVAVRVSGRVTNGAECQGCPGPAQYWLEYPSGTALRSHGPRATAPRGRSDLPCPPPSRRCLEGAPG